MLVTEGKVKIEIPEDRPVFFNQKGAKARTLGVCALRILSRAFEEDLIAADAFTGSGIRAIRYIIEGGAKLVYANDSSPYALETAKANARLNRVKSRIKFTQMEAVRFLWRLKEREIFPHFIDLDTFGSPSSFLESAILAIKRNGILYVTATDLAPLCGIKRDAAMRNYGAVTTNVEFCHETGARIVVRAVCEAAARHAFTAEPLLTYFDGSSLRILFEIRHGRKDYPVREIGFVAHCPKCKFRVAFKMRGKWESKCMECGTDMEHIGPLWIGNLHRQEFLEEMIRELRNLGDKVSLKLVSILKKMRGEIGLPPYFYDLANISDRLNIPTPSTIAVVEKLKEAGYNASTTHFRGRGFKTDAPISEIMALISQMG